MTNIIYIYNYYIYIFIWLYLDLDLYIFIYIYIFAILHRHTYIYIYRIYSNVWGLFIWTSSLRLPEEWVGFGKNAKWYHFLEIRPGMDTCHVCHLHSSKQIRNRHKKGKSDNVLCTSLLEIFGNMCSFQWILMIWFKSRYLDGMSYFSTMLYIIKHTHTHTQNIHTQYINVYNVFWIWLLDSFFTTKCSLGRRSWCSVRGKSDWWPWTAANVR